MARKTDHPADGFETDDTGWTQGADAVISGVTYTTYGHTSGAGLQVAAAIQRLRDSAIYALDSYTAQIWHPRIPPAVAAPTMRVPMVLDETINPYLAARAVTQALLVAGQGQGLGSAGLGLITAAGQQLGEGQVTKRF